MCNKVIWDKTNLKLKVKKLIKVKKLVSSSKLLAKKLKSWVIES